MAISLRFNENDAQLIKAYASMHGMSVSEFIRNSVLERIEDEHDIRAYEKAMEHFRSDNHENFIVIKVEGYDCVAYVIDEFNPISISRDIFPFDAERVFPMQGLKIEPRFMTFHECLSEM